MTLLGQPGSRRAGSGSWRRFALLGGVTLLCLAALECGARLEYRASTGGAFPSDAYRERLGAAGDADLVIRRGGQRARDADEEPERVSNKALHPYTGFVHDHSGARKSTNRFGFPGFDPLRPPAADEVRVVVTGGSVALQLFKEGGRRLREQLSRHPELAGREIRLVALTLGGFKQPQQLMSLTWFLALGAHFDVVINVDGFNEVVLPYSDNVPEGVHPAFPRSWQLYAQKSLDGDEIDSLIEVRRLQAERRRWRERLGTGLPARSVFVLRALDTDRRAPRAEGRPDGATAPAAAREGRQAVPGIGPGRRLRERPGALPRAGRAVECVLTADAAPLRGERDRILPLPAAEPVREGLEALQPGRAAPRDPAGRVPPEDRRPGRLRRDSRPPERGSRTTASRSTT